MSSDEQRDRTRDKVQHYRKRMRDEKAGRLAAEAEVQRLRTALLDVRLIGVRSGTNLNAWNEAFDVLGAALTPVPVDSTEEK